MANFLFNISFWLLAGICFAQGQVAPSINALKDSAEFYQKKGFYSKALLFAGKWTEGVKAEKGEENLEYAEAIHNWGELLYESGKSKESEPLLLKGLEIRMKVLGEEHPDVAISMRVLGNLFSELGDRVKQEFYYKKALEIRQKSLDENHPLVAQSLNNMGNLNMDLGEYKKARSYYQKALEIRTKAFGDTHPDVAASLQNLGWLGSTMGDYGSAILYHRKSLEIRQKAFGESHPLVAVSFNSLGNVYWATGNYPAAEPYYLRALEMRKKILGVTHPSVSDGLNNLGVLYYSMGDYDKAEQYYLESLEIRKKNLGETHAYIGQSYNNLGGLYKRWNKVDLAERFYLKGLEIRKNALGETHSEVAQSLNNLGDLFEGKGDFKKAESYHKQSLDIRIKRFGNVHPDVSASIFNLGLLYKKAGRFQEAEKKLLLSLDIKRKTIGEFHPELSDNLSNIGTLYQKTRDWAKADVFFEEAIAKEKIIIKRYFPAFSDREKEKYLASVRHNAECFRWYCLERFATNPAIASQLYDQQLFSKGLLLNASQKFKHRLRNTNDTAVQARFQKWEELSNRIAKLYLSSDSATQVSLKKMVNEAETLEKELVRLSAEFASISDYRQFRWTEVQKKLRPGEAAIEMVRVRKEGLSRIVIDTSDPAKPRYVVTGLVDTAWYVGLIVKPTSKYPEMVLMKSGRELETKLISKYKISIVNNLPDNESYRNFWKPIQAQLGQEVKRVYFSPDGVYNFINLNTLINPKTGKALMDELEIRQVSNTKDLLTTSHSKPNPPYASLLGYPDYNVGQDKRAEIVRRSQGSKISFYSTKFNSSYQFAELPGTKTEVENIAYILKSNGWQVDALTGEKALEETIKGLHRPRVLHIATHGFFQPDTVKEANPLVNSGLILTGANKTIQGEISSKGLDDGILTAYEAMNLNLDNTRI